ncbi:hypothetical protein A6723_009190 [Pseudomonas sp. AU11447]|uniref:FkbM family methyltransferase n=1 Tax=unclassified Pseudomonas TaxID=196821 RepID=UPI0006D473C9|nr:MULTISPECIES: FkbM family methyltransferase [unclassified Pseudomonas]OBY93321.1 hypothetical protein A6723_009190 [Pseudomonas sp. AU11447]
MQAEVRPYTEKDAERNVATLTIGESRYSIYLPNHATDYIQKKIVDEQKPYELQMLEDIQQRVAVDDLVLDIGANIGNHTLYLAAVAGCRVMAFEPNQALAGAILSSVEMNDLSERVSVRAVGVGKAKSRGHFDKDMPDNLGAQSICVGEGSIQIVALDDLRFDRAVKLLKIDVEGMELPVLQGAEALLQRDRPLLYVECQGEPEFRAISGWLDGRGYSYWDTFNATPTHLFVPNEQVDIERRLSRLQFKDVLDSYRNREQLTLAKVRLDEANGKYRSANEQIDRLKGQLAEQKQQYAADTADLTARKSEVKARLDEANSKYRQVTEQVATLKTQLADDREARVSVEASVGQLRQQVDALTAESETVRGQLDHAKAQQQTSAEQLTALEQKLAVATESKGLADRSLVQAEQRIEVLLQENDAQAVQLGQARDALIGVEAQAVNLQAELASAVASYQAQQREQLALAPLVEANTALGARLEEANGKYLQAGEQIASLKGELAAAQTQIHAQEQRYDVQAGQVALLEDQVAKAQAFSQALEAQLQSARQAADEEHRQHAQLRIALEQQSQSLSERILRCEDLEATAGGLQARLLESEKIHQQQTGDLAIERAARLDAEELLKASALQWQQLRQQLEDDLAATRSWLDAANVKYRAATGEQIPQLKTHLESMRNRSIDQQKKIEELAENLQRANAKRHLAEQRLVKTRASLTYQLGYQLKSGATSLGGFVRLPGSLLGLYRKASKQRKVARQTSIGREEPPKALPAPQHAAQASDAQRPALLADESRSRALMVAQTSDDSQVRVACIMDEFSYGSYRHECNLLQLTPSHWERELSEFRPEMLLIESAWRGKDDLWGSKVGHNSRELQGILAWCRANGVPTAFWNKEDPVHFETFLTTAKQFDHVFTTDIDCIHRYKAGLGHERVYLLPFACQPLVHNPIELYQRKDAFCFAGAYYVRYPDRTRDLGNFVAELPKFRPLEIYDRNFGKDDPNYQFPVEYQPYIVGTLPFEQIDTAYKGYRYAINLNSVKQSQSMFARRVFELIGSNTVTVSNYSRGLRLMFGDLVVTTDNGVEMLRRLNLLAGCEASSGKLRLAALRKVMQQHTYAQRMGYLQKKVLGRSDEQKWPKFAVFAKAADSSQLKRLLEGIGRQSYRPASVHILVSASLKEKSRVEGANIVLVTEKQLRKRSLGHFVQGGDWAAFFSAEDYYGDNYLLDMALATRYSCAAVIGKGAYFAWDDKCARPHRLEQAYRSVDALPARASAIMSERLSQETLLDCLKDLEIREYRFADALAIDPFNYCQSGAEADVAEQVGDLPLNVGMDIDELQSRAELIEPARTHQQDVASLSGRALAQMFGALQGKSVSLDLDGEQWRLDSSLEDAKHEYLYSNREVTPEALGGREKLELFLDVAPGLNLQLVLLMLDAQKQRVSHVMVPANRNVTAEIPSEAAFIRLGWRVFAGGSAEVKELVLGHRDLQPSMMLERSRYLLLTNNYPGYDELYRNGFVHSRVKAYREQGVGVDVFRLRKHEAVSYAEFENCDVTSGSQEVLRRTLENGRYQSVLVHFLDADMWEVLAQFVDRMNVIVWVHGAEIHPWYRRRFNLETPEQEQLARLQSDQRMAFWRSVLDPMPKNLKLVFVSKTFAQEVMEDIGFQLPEANYRIIHNPIDTQLFNYVEKSAGQRRKILSIRPFASRQYANDLSVAAILLLSKEPFFGELDIRIVGDGRLFEETVEPLRKLSNVRIDRGFLTHAQISALHKDYGLFLCPTRWDSQGVSRDEAMSSGMVPVTSKVAAVTEFATTDCAILAPLDDAGALAEGIKALYFDEARFRSMSLAAANRVRAQTSRDSIVRLELEQFAIHPGCEH